MPTPDKKLRQAAYDRTMADMRQSLNRPEAALSTALHAPVFGALLSFIGRTLFRPRALLIGTFVAIVVLAGSYFLGRMHGFASSGIEPIIGFCAGWIIGLAYDGLLALLRRR